MNQPFFPDPNTARSDPFAELSPVEAPRRTVLGEIARGLIQWMLLGGAFLAASFASLFWIGLMIPHTEMEVKNRELVDHARWEQTSRLSAAQHQRDLRLARMKNLVAKFAMAPNESPVPATGAALPSDPSPSRPAAAEEVGHSEPMLQNDPSVIPFRDAAHGADPKNYAPLMRLDRDDPRCRAIRGLLIEHLANAEVAWPSIAKLARVWQDAELAQAVLDYLGRIPPAEIAYVDWQELRKLIDTFRLPHGEVFVQYMPAMVVRTGQRPNIRALCEYGPTIAAELPDDSPLWTEHAAADTPTGDLLRGALSFRSEWPDGTMQRIGESFQSLQEPAYTSRVLWLEQLPPPEAIRDGLFRFAAQAIRRESTGDVEEDLGGVALLAALVTPNTARNAAQASVRLQSSNPIASRQLAMQLLKTYPAETIDALATSDDDRQPTTIERPRPGLQLGRMAAEVDGAMANALADWPREGLTANVVKVASDWGGSRTMRVLEELAATLPEDAAEIPILYEAVERMKGDLGADRTGGER